MSLNSSGVRAQPARTSVSVGSGLLAGSVTPIDRRTVNLDVFAKETGTGLRQVYELARRDALPVPVIRIGRRMVISRQALDDLLAPRSTGVACDAETPGSATKHPGPRLGVK